MANRIVQRQVDKSNAYLRNHALEAEISDLMTDVLIAQPEEPLHFLYKRLGQKLDDARDEIIERLEKDNKKLMAEVELLRQTAVLPKRLHMSRTNTAVFGSDAASDLDHDEVTKDNDTKDTDGGEEKENTIWSKMASVSIEHMSAGVSGHELLEALNKLRRPMSASSTDSRVAKVNLSEGNLAQTLFNTFPEQPPATANFKGR